MTILQILGLTASCASYVLAQSPRPAFEAASVKTSAPSREKRPVFGGDPGRLDWTNVSFRAIVAQAYGLKEYQVTGPDWIGSSLYDLMAKLPAGAEPSQKYPMLQTMLDERFHLASHRETRELPVYGLAVGKGGPKLKNSAESGQPETLIMNFGHLQVNAASGATLAEVLSRMMDRPVVDQTALNGAYDIDLRWTPEPNDGSIAGMKIAMAKDRGQDVKLPESSGPGLFDAIQRQLGLKLDPKKLPVEILVVDRAEKVPTEN